MRTKTNHKCVSVNGKHIQPQIDAPLAISLQGLVRAKLARAKFEALTHERNYSIPNNVIDHLPPIHSPELPSIEDVMTLVCPTVRHVPSRIKESWSRLLSNELFILTARIRSEQAWKRFFMLPKCVMRIDSSKRSGKRRSKQLRNKTSGIPERIERWKKGEILDLWKEAISSRCTKDQTKKPLEDDVSLQLKRNIKRATRLAGDGQFSRAVQALMSDGVAEPTEGVWKLLKEKHPANSPPPLPKGLAPIAQAVSRDEVLNQIRLFPKGTACGPSSLRNAHLLGAYHKVSSVTANSFLSNLPNITNALLAGKAPQSISVYLAGGTLIALKEKNKFDIRPIAIGEILRRLVSKCACSLIKEEAAKYFSPHQVGVAIKGGAEAITHAVSAVLDKFGKDINYGMLKVDFKNAFNLVNRGVMMEEVRKIFPGISKWVEFCYGCQPTLFWEGRKLSSCDGVQQGDPLGPFLFALVEQKLVNKISAEVPELALNQWYLDDGDLIGKTEHLVKAFKVISENAPELGLHLSLPKCQLFWPTKNPDFEIEKNVFPPDIERVRCEGVDLLGSPLGSEDFCDKLVMDRVQKIEKTLDMLPELDDPQIELLLLRSCVGLPKFAFPMRTCPPSKISNSIRRFDDAITASLTTIVGCPLTRSSSTQASLPVSIGGLGIRSASSTAEAAFIGSCVETMATQRSMNDDLPMETPGLNDALDSYNAKAGTNIEIADLRGLKHVQHHLCEKLDKNIFAKLVETAGQADKARLLAINMKHAGAWLNILPIKSLGLNIPSSEYRTSLKLHLGEKVYSSSEQESFCSMCKRSLLDPWGHHALICGESGDRIIRHNAVRDAILSLMKQAGLNARREEKNLLPARPGDIFVSNWSGGRGMAYDVTITSPMQTSLISRASLKSGIASSLAETRKDDKFLSRCQAQGVGFTPIALETLGGIGELAIPVFKKLINLIASNLGEDKVDVATCFYQTVSLSLQRYNASMILSRHPVPKSKVSYLPDISTINNPSFPSQITSRSNCHSLSSSNFSCP